MKRITRLSILFFASTCFAQMYTINDIGKPTTAWVEALGINNSGQVVGYYYDFGNDPTGPYAHSFLYNNGTITDIGTLITASDNYGYGINDSGQIVGTFYPYPYDVLHAYLFSNSMATDLGIFQPYAINNAGQVTGEQGMHAVLYANGTMTQIADLGAGWAAGYAINDSGYITGESSGHAFLYSAETTNDLGTFGGYRSRGRAINNLSQITGTFWTSEGRHAFLYHDGKVQDLGNSTDGTGIDDWGQITGTSSGYAALYSNGKWQDLNNLIPSGSGWLLWTAGPINDAGQIAGSGSTGPEGDVHGFLLNPIYKALVLPPINADGSSVFSGKRGVVPVKFALNQYGTQPSCTLPATIAITRASGGTLAAVDESIYSTQADSGSNFRIDPTSCQYIYNLSASALGFGTYRVDISINGIMVGHAVFALK